MCVKGAKQRCRKTGADTLGDVSWGAHFCLFYKAKEDLIDILVPYFKAGLENNEFCMWVTSGPNGKKVAERAMREAVPNFDQYLKKEQIQVVSHNQWYLKDGVFSSQRVLDVWVDKLNHALTAGFTGMRVTGDMAWLEEKDWSNFIDYEEQVNKAIGNYQMIAICSYCLDKCGASEVIDVISNHGCALIKRQGKWELIESADRKKIADCKKDEDALQNRNILLNAVTEGINDAMFIKDIEGRYLMINMFGAAVLGRSKEEIIGKRDSDLLSPKIAQKVMQDDKQVIKTGGAITKEETFQTGENIYKFLTTKEPYRNQDDCIIGLIGIARDITERKTVEETLRQSEKRLLETQKIGHMGSFEWNIQKNESVCSEELSRIFGLESGHPRSLESFINSLHPEDRDRIAKETEEIVQKKKSYEYEYRVVRPDGEERVVLSAVEVKCDKSGKPLRLVGMIQDSTDRKKAEKEIQDLAKFPAENPNTVLRISKDGEVLYSNKAGELLLSKWESGIGKTVPGKWRNLTAEVFASEKGTEEEEVEGKIFSVTIAPVKEAGYANLYATNITDRKKAEKQLLESENKYRTLTENLKELVYRADPQTFVATYVNAAIGKIYGYSKGEWLENPSLWEETIHHDDKKRVLAKLTEARENLKNDTIEYRIMRKDKTVRWVEDHLTWQKDENGKAVSLNGLLYDITERKKAQTELQEAHDKLETRIRDRTKELAKTVKILEGEIAERKQAEKELHKNQRMLIRAQHIARMGFLTWNMITNEIQWSDEIFNIYGIDQQKVKPTLELTMQLVFPDDLEFVQKNLDAAIQGITEYDIEHRILRSDGKVVWVHAQAKLAKDTDGISFLLGTIVDITKRKQIENELMVYQEQLRSLASELYLTEERERRRIAAELHSHIGENMTLSMLKLDTLRKSAPSGVFTALLDEISNLLEKVVDSTRELTFDLSSPILYRFGFERAVAEWLMQRVQDRHGIKTEFVDDGQPKPLEVDISVFLFRSVRELLINVVKHAQAQSAKVSIYRTNGQIQIIVEDDGIGLDLSQNGMLPRKDGGFGLFSIQERLNYLGGDVKIESKPGQGTRVMLTAPLKTEKKATGEN